MKKFLLLWMLALGTLASAQISYNYGWEPTGLGSWTTSGSGSFGRSTTTPCTGTASIRANNYYNLSSFLVSPALTGTNGGDLTVNFSYKVTNYASNSTGASSADFGTIKLQWSASASGPWTTVYTIDNSTHAVSATCAAKTATFSGLPAGGDVYIRFEAQSGLSTSDNYVYFDDITVSQGVAPTCLTPSGLSGNAPTSSGITLSWTATSPAPANGYQVYYSTSSTAPTATTVLNGTNSVTSTSATAPLSGLTPATTYYAWVRSNCSASDKSAWGSVFSFTTSCVPVTTLPWTENFDGMSTIGSGVLPTCWSTAGGLSGYPHTTQNSGSQTYNDPRSTPNYVTIYYPTTAADLWTPGFALTAGQSYDFSFYWTGDDTSGWQGDVFVNSAQSSTGATQLGTSFVVPATTTTPGYTNQRYTFVPSTTGTYYFGIKTSAATSAPYYMGFDDFKVEPTPACAEPVSVSITTTATSATLSWSAAAVAPANGYQYYFSTTNTTPASGTATSATSAVLSPLSPSTTYYYWVRSMCAGSESTWATGTFTTPVLPPANDICTAPVVLTPGGTFAQNAITTTNMGATSDGTPQSCVTDVDHNVWYSVQVPASGNITIETGAVSGSTFVDSVINVFTGTCGSLVAVTDGCNDDIVAGVNRFSRVVLTGLTPNSTLLVSVYKWVGTDSADGQFQISAYDSSLLATSEVASGKNVTVYPNPFHDVLYISDVKDVTSVIITDISGRTVKTIAKPTAELQLGGLTAGMYLVTLKYKDGSVKTMKAIKK